LNKFTLLLLTYGKRCCRVNGIFKNNQKVTLLRDLTKEEAAFITKKIENYLKLKEKRKEAR